MITFKAKLYKIGSCTLLKLPKISSDQLPSRGLTIVKGTINGFNFQAVLEPDGKGSHWFRFDNPMNETMVAEAGDMITMTIEPVKEWPEPIVPEDLNIALLKVSQAHSLWKDITTMARWDWIRWINSTKQPETRKRRIQTACSKLKAGEKRPCCFNRTICTEPYVSKNGVLLEPTQAV